MLQVKFDGKTVALPFNFSILNWAAKTRQILNNVQLPEGVQFYNIFGTSFDTPFDVWYVCELLFHTFASHLVRMILQSVVHIEPDICFITVKQYAITGLESHTTTL